MKLKILILSLVAFSTLIAIGHSPVKAQSIPYTYGYNATNLYSTDIVNYEFANLDSARSHLWSFWTVDEQTGNALDFIGFKTLGPGVVTGSWFFGVAVSGVNDGAWPENYTGPIYVKDDRGNTIGRHFITPQPLQSDGSNVWESAGGTFAVENRQVIGNKLSSGNCKSVVFNQFNASGFLHANNPCQSTTTLGDYALLHFQFDPTTTTISSTDDIVLVNVSVGGGTSLTLRFSNGDLCEYQSVGTFSVDCQTFTAMYSFVLINTSENELPFVNYQLADTAFDSKESFDNPYRWGSDFGATNNGLGAYTCYREVSSSPTSDCESMWLVSKDPTPTEYLNTEWYIELLDTVGEGGQQTATLRQNTSEIWNSYHGAMLLEDTYSSFTDSAIYAYSPQRQTSWTVNSTALDDVPVSWSLTPQFVYSGAVAITPADLIFDVVAIYDISQVTTFNELIDTNISQLGLDTELGRTVLHAGITFLAILSVAFIPVAKDNVISYLIAWTGAGGMWIVAGFASDTSTLFWGMFTIALWAISFMLFGSKLAGFSRNNEET